MNEKTKEVVTLACPCGKRVEYRNPKQGAINVGHLRKQTGWWLHNVRSDCAIEK